MAGKITLRDLLLKVECGVATEADLYLIERFQNYQPRKQKFKCSGGLDKRTIEGEIANFNFLAKAKSGYLPSETELTPVGKRIFKILSLHFGGATAKAIGIEMGLPATTVSKVLRQVKAAN
jgi:hypothetical protein